MIYEKNIIKYYFETIDSTNNEAKRLIKTGSTDDFAVIANEQISGRGQYERKFFSPKDTGLYLSIALKLKTDLNNSFVTQAAAVAVCKAIESLYGINLNIKPINDLFLQGKKVGGILVETIINYNAKQYFAVFGIGLNLFKPIKGFPKRISKSATYLLEEKIDRNEAVDEIIKQILIISENFNSENLKGEYEKRKINE